jgi:hypothetical protein
MVNTNLYPELGFSIINGAVTEKRCAVCDRETDNPRHYWSMYQWKTYQSTGYCAQCQISMEGADVDILDFKYGGTG